MPGPLFKIRYPDFMFGPPVAAYIQYFLFKMCPPLRFLAPLLRNPGDGPA